MLSKNYCVKNVLKQAKEEAKIKSDKRVNELLMKGRNLSSSKEAQDLIRTYDNNIGECFLASYHHTEIESNRIYSKMTGEYFSNHILLYTDTNSVEAIRDGEDKVFTIIENNLKKGICLSKKEVDKHYSAIKKTLKWGTRDFPSKNDTFLL